MLRTKEVEMTWKPANKEHLISRGYKFTKINDKIIIKIEDLMEGSHKEVEVQCDYCGKVIPRKYYEHINSKKGLDKDACKDCKGKKEAEIFNIKYGVSNPFQLDWVKSKSKVTRLNKYGVEHASQNEDIQNKQKATIKERYGVDSVMLVPEFMNKCMESKAKTLYKNGTAPCSSQQLYINNILNGILNYPVDSYNLDILLDDKIYVECDFSGHDLNVKIGRQTQKEFDKKEKYRYYYLKNRDYKMIKIISTRDNIPIDDNIIRNMIIYAKKWLNKDHSWIKFDIDNKIVITSQGIEEYNYGKLKRINRENYKKVIEI